VGKQVEPILWGNGRRFRTDRFEIAPPGFAQAVLLVCHLLSPEARENRILKADSQDTFKALLPSGATRHHHWYDTGAYLYSSTYLMTFLVQPLQRFYSGDDALTGDPFTKVVSFGVLV